MKFFLSANRLKWIIPSLVGLIITSLFLVTYLAQPTVLKRLSHLSSDILQRQFPRAYNPDSPVRIVDIDEDSIRRIGQWPWPRTTLAKLNDRLNIAGAAVIAYDIVFSEPDRTSPENMLSVLKANPNSKGEFNNISALKSHDEIFAESFQRSQVVAGMFLITEPTPSLPFTQHAYAISGSDASPHISNFLGTVHPIQTLETSASGLGHATIVPDIDGVIRQAPLFGRINERVFPSLSLEALRIAQGAQNFVIKSADASGELDEISDTAPEMAAVKVGAFEIPTTANGDIIVYYSHPSPNRYIPAWKILSDDPKDQDWLERISGHIVFLGTSAVGLKDLRVTPIEKNIAGVLVHAQISEQVIDQSYLRRPYWASLLEIMSLLICGLFISLLVPRLSAARGVILFLIILNITYLAAMFAFTRYKYVIDPAYPILATIGTYLGVALSSFYLTETERSRIRNAFSMYLSPTMVRQVSDNPDRLTLGGQDRELTILFLDVRGFSSLSEKMNPQEITTFLNKFLTPMTNILQKHHATIDKYIGDAIVAFWNAPLDDPKHVENSARAILEMQDTLNMLNKEYPDENEFIWPGEVRVGIGLNTGMCCVGNLGSEQRFSYSMIGDAANLASRIEGLTKPYGISNLIGNTTADSLKDFAILEIDVVKVVGRVTPETIFAVIGDEALAKQMSFIEFRYQHDTFLSAYRDRSWDRAESIAKEQMAKSATLGLGNYYDMMIKRVDGYKNDPPPTEWDGVFEASAK